MKENKKIAKNIENISSIVLAILFFGFPLTITSLTTDPFILPKQIFLGVATVSLLLLLGLSILFEKNIQIRSTPFNLPIFLFLIAVCLSSLNAVNHYQSLLSFFPIFFAILTYFLFITLIKTKTRYILIVSALVLGASFISINSIFLYLHIYILPFAFTHTQAFTPLGSLLDQALYLSFVLPIACYFSWFYSKGKKITPEAASFAFSALVVALGLLITIFEVLTIHNASTSAILLPFGIGFQTAFASISQDSTRTIPSFLFGSGIGTYATDFTRFKQATFNLNQDLWSLTFLRSSSFILELLATTGVLGLGAFLFLVIRVVKNKRLFVANGKQMLFFALAIGVIAAFLFPFSFTIYSIFFFVLGITILGNDLLHETSSRHENATQERFSSYSFPYGASSSHQSSHQESKQTELLPLISFVFCLMVIGVIVYEGVQYATADMLFQKSIVASTKSDGQQTYTLQSNAISTFPYNDSYHRVFSQVNLQLANSLSAQARSLGATPSAQTQQTIYQLIQQSISAARTATTLAPYTVQNWQNLSFIYTNLIGFGQNAENFAILADQQAILLDQNNPQEYLNLGGIYYQLGQWENAIRQFQIAVSLKPDLPNAYYNLGHALEQKGDLQNAKLAYQAVKQLAKKNDENDKKISHELETLEKKIAAKTNEEKVAGAATQNATPTDQSPLKISTSSSQLTHTPLVKIAPPPNATGSSQPSKK